MLSLLPVKKGSPVVSYISLLGFSTLLMGLSLTLSTSMTARAQESDNVTVVRYPAADMEQDVRSTYYYKLLEASLEKTKEDYGPYKLVGVQQVEQSQTESLKSAMNNQGLDVIHTMTTKARELVLRPIHIPLGKGLVGMRILLIREEDKGLFSDVSSASRLRVHTFGQGEGWPDTEILDKNGLEVKTANYSKLFTQLSEGEFDAFPRAIYEIWGELEQFDEYNFAAEQNLLIHYPSAMYFFVSKKDKELANRIETGLERVRRDGTFDKLFDKYMGRYIENANLAERKILRLKNPLLSSEVPLRQDEYWFDLEQYQ